MVFCFGDESKCSINQGESKKIDCGRHKTAAASGPKNGTNSRTRFSSWPEQIGALLKNATFWKYGSTRNQIRLQTSGRLADEVTNEILRVF